MDDDIGRPQRLDGAHGEQAGIARTGTDKDDAPTRAGIEKTWHGGESGVRGAACQFILAWGRGSGAFDTNTCAPAKDGDRTDSLRQHAIVEQAEGERRRVRTGEGRTGQEWVSRFRARWWAEQ